MENYRIIKETIGEGTFGTVSMAKHLPSNTVVALKQINIKRQDCMHGNVPKQPLREMRSLQQVEGHENVLKLYEAFADGNALVLSMEYVPRDLSSIIRTHGKNISESCIKSIILQTLRGVAWCHRRGIMHRDIKPANLLVTNQGVVKVADFGLGTIYLGKDTEYSHQVATRWYRAPELLYGSTTYDFGVDMYAVGCVLGEMINHCPVFPGTNDIDQLTRVMSAFGNPDESMWPGVSKLPDYDKITLPKCQPTPMKDIFPDASEEALSLLSGLLHYDSAKRLTAEEALRHPYFFKEPIPCNNDTLALLLNLSEFPVIIDKEENDAWAKPSKQEKIETIKPFKLPGII